MALYHVLINVIKDTLEFDMRQNKIQKTSNQLIDYAVLVIVAMVLIYVVYAVAAILIGQVPAVIGSGMVGLVGSYIFITNKKVREELLKLGK
jgi:hypothetical protein